MREDHINLFPGNYLVAGSSGLMGTTALKRLRNRPGINVRATYNKTLPRVSGDNITLVKANLTNPEFCKEIVIGIDFVLMFAGQLSTAPVMAVNPVSHITENMVMNAQMLESSYFAGVKKFLWLSSSTGYPMIEGLLTENNMFDGDPPDSYFYVGWMSRYTEILCKTYSLKLKEPMTIIVLRPTTIYGEYEDFHFEKSHVLPALVRRVVERHKPIEVWGTGENLRDFIYSDDVFDACLISMQKVEKFDVFNVGSGREHTVNDLLHTIIEVAEFRDSEIVYTKDRPTSISKRCIDVTKIKRKLGFEAKTTLENGIKKVVEYYRNNPIKDI